jgi:hypothetical protein
MVRRVPFLILFALSAGSRFCLAWLATLSARPRKQACDLRMEQGRGSCRRSPAKRVEPEGIHIL